MRHVWEHTQTVAARVSGAQAARPRRGLPGCGGCPHPQCCCSTASAMFALLLAALLSVTIAALLSVLLLCCCLSCCCAVVCHGCCAVVCHKATLLQTRQAHLAGTPSRHTPVLHLVKCVLLPTELALLHILERHELCVERLALIALACVGGVPKGGSRRMVGAAARSAAAAVVRCPWEAEMRMLRMQGVHARGVVSRPCRECFGAAAGPPLRRIPV